MTAYGIVLFLHIACAILLVGGSLWAHIGHASMRRARTVDGALTQAGFISLFAKTAGPLAAGTFLAGLFLTFEAERWGDAWLLIALGLFVLAGAGFGSTIAPGARRQVEVLTAAQDGPLTPGVLADLHDARYELVFNVLAGADFAILFLMTNKPELIGSLVVAAIGLLGGAAIGARHSKAPATTAPAEG